MIMNKSHTKAATALLLALTVGATASADQPTEHSYHLSRTIPLAGDGFWDYLTADSAARRLYVAHSDHVAVLDIDNGEVVGAIPGLQGVHGVAVATGSGHGFVSDGRAGDIVMFDLKSLGVLAHLPAGDNPDAIILEPVSQRVFAFNHSGGDVTVINSADGSPAGTVQVGGELEFAVADGRGSVFVNVEDTSDIVQIDRNLEVVNRWPLAPCEQPTGLAMDPQTRRLFSACRNAMVAVVDADDGHVVTSVPIGHGCDGVRLDPDTGLIFTANGEGTLSIIREDTPDTYQVVGSVPTQRGARTLEIDLPTHKIFTATAKYGPMPPENAGRPLRPPILPGSFVVLEFSR